MGLAPGSDIAEAVSAMNNEIGLPPGLAAMGIEEDDIPGLIEHAKNDMSGLTNPRSATEDDFEAMIRESL